MSSQQQKALVAAARQAARNAYAPYSGFHVGAALLLTNGDIISAANVENASYGLSLCAETVAVARLANEDRLDQLVAVAVIGGRPDDAGALTSTDPVHPCGRCRQILNEAAQRSKCDIAVHCASGDGKAAKSYKLSELLPAAFGPKDLGLID